MVNTGGQARHPAATEHLMRYWSTGEGGARIGWGSGGDHTRCVRLIQEAIVKHGGAPLPDHEIHGLCTTLEKRATGHANSGGTGGNHGHH